MTRNILSGIAALALMTGPAFAQDSHYSDRVVGNTVRVGVGGAGVGAIIGCLVTLPVCGPGAAVGAAWGGGSGAVIGAASTRPPRSDSPPRDR